MLFPLCAPAKGHFSVSVPVESDLAPVARVLIYAILPSGEIIADSAKYNVENCLDNKVSSLYYKISTFQTNSYYLTGIFYI